MSDFPPQRPKTIKTSELLHRGVDQQYENLRTLVQQLSTSREEERTQPLLTFLQQCKQQCTQLLSLTFWSHRHANVLKRSSQILQHAESYRNQTNETNDRLFFMHANLDRAKERMYDLSTAIDVLYKGSYLRLPSVIERAMYPREFPPHNLTKTADTLNNLIRYRLIQSNIPKQFTSISLDHGFVYFTCSGQFEIVFTLQGLQPDAVWHVVRVHTILTDVNALQQYQTHSSAFRIFQNSAPNPTQYAHIRNLLQTALNHAEEPFLEAFKLMKEFCASLALHILRSQAQLLLDGPWKHRLSTVYHRQGNMLDFMYWPHRCSASSQSQEVLERRKKASIPPFSTSGMSVRFSIGVGKQLVAVQLHPQLSVSISNRTEKILEMPTNMLEISAERLLLAAMKAHAKAFLEGFQRLLFRNMTKERGHCRLLSGQCVWIQREEGRLQIRNANVEGLCHCIELTFDIRQGKCIVSAPSTSMRSVLYQYTKSLEDALNTQCKLQMTEEPHRPADTHKSDQSKPFTLFLDHENALKTLQSLLCKALNELTLEECINGISSLKRLEVYRNIQIEWQRYKEVCMNDMEAITISENALFVQLLSLKHSNYYLIIEIDPIDRMDVSVPLDDDIDHYIHSPQFSLIQLNSELAGQQSAQFFHRFPPIRKQIIATTLRESFESANRSAKASLAANLNTFPCKKKCPFKAVQREENANIDLTRVLIHMIHQCHDRIQLHQCMSFARRRKARIRFTGSALSMGKSLGHQVVTFAFPEEKMLAMEIDLLSACLMSDSMELHARLRGVSMQPSASSLSLCIEKLRYVKENGDVVFRYKSNDSNSENPLENCLMEVANLIKPMCVLRSSLKQALALAHEDCHFFMEHADPFEIVLASKEKVNGACYRLKIQCKPKSGFVLAFTPITHPLLPFIQSAFNVHQDAVQLLEALERTAIPLGLLWELIQSPAALYYSSVSELKKAKGMVNRLEPRRLLFIPRSQTHVRLVYDHRSLLDIRFLKKRAVHVTMWRKDEFALAVIARNETIQNLEQFSAQLPEILSELAT
uniref:Mediator of RNA polymerase II transcription subunit 14 n=1 Tax=Albugo laibachii Nc14 TaxID=890382 RepID=F0W2P3_9STRA|nr:conserved hypothetical protein [Albugo laibachii Nc14]|eukprot:CCA15329.1 conserved hypothetical protein [Albugo laibachii Nc14]